MGMWFLLTIQNGIKSEKAGLKFTFENSRAGSIFSARLVMVQPCPSGSVGRGNLSDFNVF